MSHYTRPVKNGIALVVAYPPAGAAVIHAAGCAHTQGNRTVRDAVNTSYDAQGLYEDWYEVAPCAAAGKGRICTRFGADCNC